jgi:phospholipid/cholesterol/gamma-HCH transport system ATP-binding protein
MYQGKGWWKGDSKSIITTEDEQVLSFVYASEFMKEIRQTMQSTRK